MFSTSFHRRVLLISPQPEELKQLFSHSAMSEWEVIAADSSAAAVLLLQNNPASLILTDQSHFDREGLDGMSWIMEREQAPMLFVSDTSPAIVAKAYQRGLSLWLPRTEVLRQPLLLAGAMDRTMRWQEMHGRYQRMRRSLDDCQRQVDRLVSLLWRTAPMNVENQWYTHRHMLERLEEEIARASRYQIPLTIALGEVELKHSGERSKKGLDLMNWTAEEVARRKRRSDVAGQYGQHGFMLMMAQTPVDGGRSCCRRLQHQLQDAAGEFSGPRDQIQTCFGLAAYSSRAATAQRMLRCAEEHLEAARKNDNERIVAE